MKHLYILFFLATFSSFAQYQLEDILHTQEINDNETEILEESDNQTEYVQSEEIQQNMASSLDDILRLTTGATTSRGPRSSAEAPQIRGLDVNKIFVSVDGVIQNYQEGHSSMLPIDTENIKLVTINKNNSNFSQTNSICGGVEFKSKDPEDYLLPNKTQGAQIKAQYNSANNEKIYGGKTAFRKNSISGYLSLTSSDADNLKLNNESYLANSSYKDLSFFTKFKFRNFRFSYENFVRKDNSPLDPSMDPETKYNDLLADSTLTKHTVNAIYENKKRVKLQAYFNKYQTQKIRRSDKQTQLREIETTGFKVNKDFNFLSLGVQTYRDKLNSDIDGTQINSFPKAERNIYSGYIDGHLNLGKSYFVPGLKFDAYSMKSNFNDVQNSTGQKLTKKLEYHYKFSSNFKSKLSYTEGFNAPKVNEVFPSGLHRPSDDFLMKANYFIPNPNLKHEESSLKEVNLSYKNQLFSTEDQIKFNISYFENDIKDYITLNMIDVSIFDERPSGTTQFINIPKAKIYGAEIGLNYLIDLYDISLNYSQIRGRNLTDHLFIQDMPADSYNLTIKSYLDKYDLILGYTISHTLSQSRVNPETTQNTLKTPGYTLQDAFVKKNFKNFELSLKVNNIGNIKYRKHASFLNESSEDIRLGFKYKVNTY